MFFETVLKEYPENKTAKLCYGRAVGLLGNSEKAVSIFTDLLKVYPSDFEIKLNYAESLLWNKNYSDAKTFYEGLIKEDDKSFPALLGYANTLSNLKIYDKALIFVNQALEVLPGNPNALTSKKYIYLGYAYQNQQAQNYEEAEKLLKENVHLAGTKMFGDFIYKYENTSTIKPRFIRFFNDDGFGTALDIANTATLDASVTNFNVDSTYVTADHVKV